LNALALYAVGLIKSLSELLYLGKDLLGVGEHVAFLMFLDKFKLLTFEGFYLGINIHFLLVVR
jgi:hypothetical protein